MALATDPPEPQRGAAPPRTTRANISLQPAKLLKIYLTESHSFQSRPLVDVLVERALHSGIAGATVLTAVGGYGHHHQLHTTRLLDLAHDLPRVVELVDSAEKIDAFIAGNQDGLAETTLVLIDAEMHTAV